MVSIQQNIHITQMTLSNVLLKTINLGGFHNGKNYKKIINTCNGIVCYVNFNCICCRF